MLRRLLIRSSLFIVFALLLTAWIASHFYAFYGHRYSTSGNLLTLGVFDGFVDLAYCDNAFPNIPGWAFDRFPLTDKYRSTIRQEYRDSQFHFLGFAFDNRTVASHVTTLWFPLWFPTVSAAALLLLNCRKSHVARTGFPVEPSQPSPSTPQ